MHNRYVCVYLYVFIKKGEGDGEKEWTETSTEKVPVFQGKLENEHFLKAAWPKPTSG